MTGGEKYVPKSRHDVDVCTYGRHDNNFFCTWRRYEMREKEEEKGEGQIKGERERERRRNACNFMYRLILIT